MTSRLGLLAVLLLCALSAFPTHAADDFPQRPLKIIVPFPAAPAPTMSPAWSASICRTRSARPC